MATAMTMITTKTTLFFDSILDLIKCNYAISPSGELIQIEPKSVKGLLWTSKQSPHFINGKISVRARSNGRYPYGLLEMIDELFGPSDNTIEVCSGYSKYGPEVTTVDINPNCKPDIVDDGQFLRKIPTNKFDRWRCDPPYNEETASKMYKTTMPEISKLLQAGSRVIKEKSLMFLLLGHQIHQACPKGVIRIGSITMSLVPNNELRELHIFYKYGDS